MKDLDWGLLLADIYFKKEGVLCCGAIVTRAYDRGPTVRLIKASKDDWCLII